MGEWNELGSLKGRVERVGKSERESGDESDWSCVQVGGSLPWNGVREMECRRWSAGDGVQEES